jgi:hypothetical protein
MTANTKVTRLTLYALLGLLIPLGVIGFLFRDLIGVINLAMVSIAIIGPLFTARLAWEHRCHSEGLSLAPLENRGSLAVPSVLVALSALPLILFTSSLFGWPGLLVGGIGLLAYAILQWFAVTRAWSAYHAEYLARQHAKLASPPAA